MNPELVKKYSFCLFLVLIFSGLVFRTNGASPASSYEKVRLSALKRSKASLNLDLNDRSAFVYGLIMEATFEKGTATLATYLNGETCLLFSTEENMLKREENREAVEAAARKVVKAASLFISQTAPCKNIPAKPAVEQVCFYFLTSDGLFSYESSAKALNLGRDPLSGLFMLCNDLVGELRKSESER